MPHEPPKKITIGGIVLSVRVDPSLDSWGEYHSDKREILLASRTLDKASTLRETLRHEMTHAALDICGLSHLVRYEEETIVRALENVFFPAWDKVRKQLK